MLRVGELREKIKVERQVRIPGTAGGGSYTPDPILDTFAKVRELKSDPDMIASQENVKQVISFLVRYREDVILRNGDTLTWRGISFTLNNFKVDALRTTIEMLCTQVDNSADRTEPEPPVIDVFGPTFDLTFN